MIALFSNGNDPYINLSIEEALFRNFTGTEPVLYLWINRPSVIIGRNQNAWRECDKAAMDADGVLLVRRDSGGGAVYHDLQNLLFSFVMPPSFDTDFSYGIMLKAFGLLGIESQLSGRNDILSGGRKFSGSAYMRTKNALLHHGTVLVDTDLTSLSRYLRPSEAKIKAKGVTSVRQRVVNLKEIRPDITMETVMRAVLQAFGAQAALDAMDFADGDYVQKRAAERREWGFLYGSTPEFDIELEAAFPAFELQLCLNVENAVINKARVFSDMLDSGMPGRMERALEGKRFTPDGIASALEPISPETAGWARGLNI